MDNLFATTIVLLAILAPFSQGIGPANAQVFQPGITYYPPVGGSAVLKRNQLINGRWLYGPSNQPASSSKQPVVATHCTAYTTSSLEPDDTDEIFCITSNPNSETFPQTIAQVLSENQAVGINSTDLSSLGTLPVSGAVAQIPATFAWYMCAELNINSWFTASSNINGINATYGQPGHFGPSELCNNALICFQSTTGLPQTPFQPNTSYTATGGAQGTGSTRNYYCCIETTLLESGALTSVTRCVFQGTVPISTTGTCLPDSYGEICIQTVTTSNDGTVIHSFSDFKCTYSCEFPCVSTNSGAITANCGQPPYGDCKASVSVQNQQCTVVASVCLFGSVLTGIVNNTSSLENIVTSFSADISQQCVTGQLNCIASCTCYGGCPEHPTCSSRGTLYQSPSTLWFPLPLAQFCSCDPGFYGDNCEFAIQQGIRKLCHLPPLSYNSPLFVFCF